MRALFVLLALCACGDIASPSADEKQAEATISMLQEAERQVGMPAIKNWQERKLMKMILELRDQADLTTYAYIVTWDGKLVFLNKCVGFGLPYSVQFTNPRYHIYDRYYGNIFGYTLPQADPNGLFMPEGLDATWLMMFNEESGEAEPVYVEPEIIVSPFPLHNT